MNTCPEPPVPVQRIFATHQALVAVLRLGTTEIRQRGVLFTEGERARFLLILLRGEITLSGRAAGFCSDAKAGACIGLYSVLTGTYGMQAANESVIVVRMIPRTALLELIAANDDVRGGVQSYVDAFGGRTGEAVALPRNLQHGVAGR